MLWHKVATRHVNLNAQVILSVNTTMIAVVK